MHGIHAALVTPFSTSDEVDLKSLDRLARHCLDNGASGLVALGTTGEAPLLTDAERRAVLETCRAVAIEYGVPLTVGAGTMGTADTIAEARERALFADALLTVVPYYLRPSDEAVIDHFAAVGAAVDVPLVVYDIPYRTGKHLSAETLLRILDLDAVSGVKHCPGGIGRDTLALLASGTPKSVLCGDDPYLYPMLRLGASGGITASACLAPAAFAALVEAPDPALHNALLPLVEALFSEPAPAVLKACLHARGLIDAPGVRAPLAPPRQEPVARALAALRNLA